MRHFVLIVSIILIVVLAVVFWPKNTHVSREQPAKTDSKNMAKITSPVFGDSENIPKKYTCDGDSVSPPLSISDAPENTKSLALILDDLDAPSGNFNHWLLWNIDPGVKKVAENSVPQGAIVGVNSGGKNNYFGPCPPSGMHRYIFTVYVLDTALNIPASSNKADLEKAMEGHIVDQGELMGKYARQ